MYEGLIIKADFKIKISEKPLKYGFKGIMKNNRIIIDKNIPTSTEKACILAEELGHYYTSSGNILDLSDIRNQKQEKRARNWAYEKLIPLRGFVKASKEGIRNRYDLAEFLNVTEEFLGQAIEHYKEKYGLCVEWTSYVIYFEPLGVLELFDEV